MLHIAVRHKQFHLLCFEEEPQVFDTFWTGPASFSQRPAHPIVLMMHDSNQQEHYTSRVVPDRRELYGDTKIVNIRQKPLSEVLAHIPDESSHEFSEPQHWATPSERESYASKVFSTVMNKKKSRI